MPNDYSFDFDGFLDLQNRAVWSAQGRQGGAVEACEKAEEIVFSCDRMWIAYNRLEELLFYAQQERQAAVERGKPCKHIEEYCRTLKVVLALFDTRQAR